MEKYFKIWVLGLFLCIAIISCDINCANNSNNEEDITPPFTNVDIANDAEKDPCYWCFKSEYYEYLAQDIDCKIRCPCNSVNPIIPPMDAHLTDGVIIDIKSFSENGELIIPPSPCINVDENSTEVDIPLIYYYEEKCDSINCDLRIPRPTLITATLVDKNTEFRKITEINHQITACDFKPNKCSKGSSCVNSFRINFSIGTKEICRNDYCIIFNIDHDHLQDGTQPENDPHNHRDTMDIKICPCGEEAINN